VFSTLLTVLLAFLGVSLLIVFHEFGHYLCARATGMRVDRFSVLGIGPVVWRLGNRNGTEFVISAIPFGAYVHIVGMEAGDDPAQALLPLPSKDGKITPPVVYDGEGPVPLPQPAGVGADAGDPRRAAGELCGGDGAVRRAVRGGGSGGAGDGAGDVDR
jgi:membrane-associated protease RseP (regulator of RpoE activity)